MDFEVLVMDDNSPDETWLLARELSQTRPWLRSIRRLSNRGLSPAVVEGFIAAKGDVLLVMDADLQHDENVIPKFMDAFENGADLVVGSRKVEGGGVENWNPTRRFVSWVATQMAYLALPRTVTDPMSGFFAVRREFFHSISQDINARGFKILLEIAARSKGRTIREVGFTFRGRIHGESKLSTKVMTQYLQALYELSVGRIVPLRFLKYGLVGLSGVVVNLGGLSLGKNLLSLPVSSATAFGIELSVLSNFVLNNAWTFRDVKHSGFVGIARGLVSFHFVCLAGALINFAVAAYLRNAGFSNHYFADLFGIVVATIWNYIVNTKATWHIKR
jgi:dolichol-phosphate mannosyltransferase